MKTIRTRWAAIGAAVAITLGAGGIGLVDAARTTGSRDVYTAIAPCRVADTRPDYRIGGRSTPLGPADVHTIKVTGSSGQCANIPTDITAVALNITALQASQRTHLTVWPAGPLPNSSSLNPAPGEPPTPNAVTTKIHTDGTFRIYNNSGTVHVIVDVVGYYQDHNHDDRYYTKNQIDGRTKAYELSIPASAFDVRNPNSVREIGSGGQFIVAVGIDDLAYAPVVLPDGAVITGIRAWMWDSSASSLRVQLRAVANTGGYTNISPELSSTGSSSSTKEYRADVDNWALDTSAHSLVVQAFVPDGDWDAIRFDIRLQHVIVEYRL